MAPVGFGWDLPGPLVDFEIVALSLNTIVRVHPEMVDRGPGQGLSVFATAGIVGLFRGLQKSENAALGDEMLFPDGH
jgi:hypothetical protein